MSDEDSMTALLAKVKQKAEAEKKEADRKPHSVEEAESMNERLTAEKDKLKQHLSLLTSVKVTDANRKEYQEAAAAIESAYSSVKGGIQRTTTIVQASRILPHRKRKCIQVAFLFDATASMTCGDIIKNVKDTISQLTGFLGAVSSLDVAVGFVCYRDYNDNPRYEIQDFTSDLAHFQSKLAGVRAAGGGDEAEDVLGGFMQVVNKLSWGPRNETLHVVIFMGDAPGHGLWDKRVQRIGDNFPDGDRDGLTVEHVCAKLLQQQVTLAFLRVTTKTDYMIKLFDDEMTSGGMAVVQEDYRNVASCRDSIERLLLAASSVSATHGGTFATTNTSARPGHVKRGVPKLDKNDSNPQTVTIKGILMVQQSMALSATTALKVAMDLLRAPTAEELKLRESNVTDMKLQVPWFSAGGVRFAHEAHFGRDQVVAKDFQWGEDNLSRHLDEFRSTLIAQALAFLFCSKLSISPEKFHYVQTQIFCARQSDLPRHVVKYYSVERFIKGEFLKFNSNGGYLNPSYEMAQAFSHYSFHVCDGRLMVLDIQGFFDTVTKEYLLTDPAIMTDDYELLPTATNLGKDAMMDFLKVHKCGPLCQALGIPSLGVPAAAATGGRR